MEKKSIKDFITTVRDSLRDGLQAARSKGIPRKVLAVVFGIIAASFVFVLLFKALDSLLNAFSRFVEEHFPSIAAAAAGGSFLVLRHNEKAEAQRKAQAQQRSELDQQRTRFAKGCYNRIGKFLFAEIATAPNFTDLTSCGRPQRPDDMGNERMDAFVINGVIYLRYSLPKMVSDTLDTKMISSVIQGLMDQRIKCGGLSPFMSPGENTHLFVDSVEDMQTYVSLTLVLDFDDKYIQQRAYQNAMNDILAREQANTVLKDSDYD